MGLKKGELRGYDTGTHTADVRLAGGYKEYLEGVAVARNIAGAEMVTGRRVAVAFFDEFTPRDAVVVAVYTP